MKTKLLRCDVEFFIEEQYPLTILADRYNGCYSGAKFLAFPRDHFDIEEEVAGDDGECRHYWDTFDDLVGKGPTIQAAVDDLMAKMKQEAADGFVHCTTIEERLARLDLTLPEDLQIAGRNAEDTPPAEPPYPVGGISGEERFRKNPLEFFLNKEQQEKLAERFKENDGPVHHVSGNAIVNLFGKFKKDDAPKYDWMDIHGIRTAVTRIPQAAHAAKFDIVGYIRERMREVLQKPTDNGQEKE